MLTFKSVSTIEFKDMESLEAFIRTLPLPPQDQMSLLDGDTVIDASDQAAITGAGKTVHEFSWEGSE